MCEEFQRRSEMAAGSGGEAGRWQPGHGSVPGPAGPCGSDPSTAGWVLQATYSSRSACLAQCAEVCGGCFILEEFSAGAVRWAGRAGVRVGTAGPCLCQGRFAEAGTSWTFLQRG